MYAIYFDNICVTLLKLFSASLKPTSFVLLEGNPVKDPIVTTPVISIKFLGYTVYSVLPPLFVPDCKKIGLTSATRDFCHKQDLDIFQRGFCLA